MVNETTDKTIGDANVLVPRVIKRGSVTFSSYSAYGSLYRSTASVVLENVLASNNPIVECYYYTSGGGIQSLNRMNYSASTSGGDLSIIAFYYLTTTTYNGKTVIQINFEHVRTNQSSRSVYYIVYSGSFTDEVVF